MSHIGLIAAALHMSVRAAGSPEGGFSSGQVSETVPVEAIAPPSLTAGVHEAFLDFIARFHKNYTGEEKDRRFAIFEANYAFIAAHNRKDYSCKLGLGAFADLTTEEFASVYTMSRPERPGMLLWGGAPDLGVHEYSNVSLPSSVDWVVKGAVTSVKNQQPSCGSCWSFAATGALEGAWQIATGQLISLSEQEFIDCSFSFGNRGCDGGSPAWAFTYAKQAPMCTEASYAYKAKVGSCHVDTCAVGIVQKGVRGFKMVKPGDESALMEAVMKGPVAIAVQANKRVFQLYKSGVLSDQCGEKVDHGVLLVGYGTDSGQDYFRVKNSWGDRWGENGYVRIARGKQGNGECGILVQSFYPVVDGSMALWWYSIPWVYIALALLGAVLLLLCFCRLGVFAFTRLQARRSLARAPPLFVTGSAGTASVAPATQQLTTSAPPQTQKTQEAQQSGNSRKSRLLHA